MPQIENLLKTAEEFATQLERLIAQARDGGLSDNMIIVGLEAAVDAIEKELEQSPDSGAGQ